MIFCLEPHNYPEVYICRNPTPNNVSVTMRFKEETKDRIMGVVKPYSQKCFVNKIVKKWHPKWKKLIIKGYWRINDYK